MDGVDHNITAFTNALGQCALDIEDGRVNVIQPRSEIPDHATQASTQTARDEGRKKSSARQERSHHDHDDLVRNRRLII